MNAIVVYKRDNKWATGTITEDRLRKKKSITKLSDVTEKDDYITLKKYLKDNKIKTEPDVILEQFKVQSIYFKKEIVVRPKEDKSPTTLDKGWWKKMNVMCLKCKNNCKQSAHVSVIACKMVPITENKPVQKKKKKV